MGKKTEKTSESSTESLNDITESIHRESLGFLRAEIRTIIKSKPSSKGRDRASRVAWLTKQVTAVSAEVRKAEKTKTDALRKLSSTSVMEWIKLQSPQFRERFVREVIALDAKERKSVLG